MLFELRATRSRTTSNESPRLLSHCDIRDGDIGSLNSSQLSTSRSLVLLQLPRVTSSWLTASSTRHGTASSSRSSKNTGIDRLSEDDDALTMSCVLMGAFKKRGKSVVITIDFSAMDAGGDGKDDDDDSGVDNQLTSQRMHLLLDVFCW